MKIGIPKALLYHYYYPFWNCLLTELGCEVVLSDDTNTNLITDGIKVTVSEMCVPIKIFNGHVLNLLAKDVDYIFIPQFISQGKEWFCPKFVGLGEIVKYSILDSNNKLIVLFIENKTDIPDKFSCYEPLCSILGVKKLQLRRALKKAKKVFLSFRSLCTQGYTVSEAFDILDGKSVTLEKRDSEITIGLMGYVYNVYDNYVSMNIIEKLRQMGVRVITFDMVDENEILPDRSRGKQPFWVFARKIYNASQYIDRNERPDGFIHLTAFCCGPDSIISKMMELDFGEDNIPFMTVRVDEHTGESHVQTRIEAFVDMLKISKQ